MLLTDPIPSAWLDLARERGACETALLDLSRSDVPAGILDDVARLAKGAQ